MLLLIHLVALLLHNVLGVAVPIRDAAVFVTAVIEDPLRAMITPSPSVLTQQELSAISASISSLLGLLHPPSNISDQLSAFPTSVLSDLEGPNVISAVDQLYAGKGSVWFTALPPGAESWVLGLPSQAVTILPQVISLQSLANDAVYTALPTLTLVRPEIPFPTVTSTPAATVTATAHANPKRVTQGTEIGLIVGAAAFLAISITLGVFFYDVRRKKFIAREMRAAHEHNLAVNPRKVGVTPYRLRQSQQSHRSSRQSQQSPSELGGGGGVLQGDEIQSAPHEETYEMHTPEVR